MDDMNIDVSAVAKAVYKALLNEQGAGDQIPVGISNRHIHLTQEHVEILFGKGYQLTPIKDLSQPGQYACKETLTIVGPSMRPIENVRVLGPIRKASQVEISHRFLYLKAQSSVGIQEHRGLRPDCNNRRKRGFAGRGLHYRQPSYTYEP